MDFRILGPLEVHAGDVMVPLGGAKQRGLLAILLLHAGEVVSNDRLIDALWGEHPPDTAPKALQVHVSQLRKALGASVIQTRSPGYVLELGPAELDVDRFRRLHEEARTLAGADPPRARGLLTQALELWRGPPLADFAYEPFAQADIGRLEEMRIAATEDRIEADLALGRHAGMAGELESLIAEHPHRERLRGLQMLALYRSGRQAEALEAFQDARTALTGELGIEPGRELRDLQAAILRQDPELDHRPLPEGVPARRDNPFVGREAELTELGTALEDSLAGHGRAVFVSGEPGIGKSRLADELAARARQRGAHVLVGRCWEAGGAPAYWPWVQALRAYLREGDLDSLRPHLSGEGADVATILPELRELVPDLPAPLDAATEGARFRLLESIASFLRRAAASRPLVLFFDDLHAADATSLLVLRFVAGQLSDTPILIVGSYRDTEVGPDLAEALAELGREPAVRRLALKGLDESITSQLLEAVMGEEPAGDLAAQVQAETQGNPLFAGEIGRLLASEGSPADGRRGLPIPEGVRETIRRRLGRQSERCREVLTLASVVGREFDPEVIGRVGDIGEDELYDVLDEAAAARLVGAVAEAGPRLRFSHILIRDALYRDLRVPQRIRLHRAVAEALDALYAGNAEPHLAELAHHYLEGGTAVAARAIEYAQRAGDRAASQHGYEEAARHYTSALELIERTGSDDEDRPCELLLSLGEALSRAGGEREARDALLRAASLAEKAGRPDQLARAALEYGGRFAWARASTDPAMVPLLERALIASGGEDSPTRVRLLARLASAARDEPTRDRRVGLAKECLSSAKRLGDPVTLAFALDGYWTAVEGPHNHAEGIAAGAQLIALGEQVGDSERVFAGHDHRLHLFWQLADRGGVEYELEALNVLADDLRQPAQQWHVGTGATMVALMEGRFERAEELISQTAELGSRTESWNALVSQRLALFTLRHAQGRLAEHVDTIARSVHEYPALQRFRCALVHAYAELDRRRDCRVAFDRLLSGDLGNEYVDAEWLFSMSLLADPCAYLGDRDAAAALYALLLPHERHYAQAPVETVFGSLARGLGVLAATLERLDEAERHFEVAIETERSMRAPPWRAHAEHGLAATLLARGGAGDVERSGTLLDEALATYREHGMRGWAERAAALRKSAAVG